MFRRDQLDLILLAGEFAGDCPVQIRVGLAKDAEKPRWVVITALALAFGQLLPNPLTLGMRLAKFFNPSFMTAALELSIEKKRDKLSGRRFCGLSPPNTECSHRCADGQVPQFLCRNTEPRGYPCDGLPRWKCRSRPQTSTPFFTVPSDMAH